MNRNQLLQIAPLMGIARADTFLGPIERACARYSINTIKRQAHFLAQLLHESQNFGRMVENLNYTPAGLLATFGHHFTEDQAEQYGRTPEHPANPRMIAQLAYNGRMGNLPNSEDGWRFRGRGGIQLTGRSNYTACGAAIGYDLVSSPELVQEADVGMLAGGWFWNEGNRTGKSLNALADIGDVAGIRKIVNGGTLGLQECTTLTTRALGVLGAAA